MPDGKKRVLYATWVALICLFAVAHAVHLDADFPNHTPWVHDWAKYTDEGWYGSAAVRAHLFGNWYMAGDFNPAPALPVWPFLEWLVFFGTGVSIAAARGLAVAFFFANLVLSYWLLRRSAPRWVALLALTLLVTSPFLYCFSRLAILEPSLTALTLLALNLSVRLDKSRRAIAISGGIGVLFTLMMLTKTTAIFLLPALAWAIGRTLWSDRVRMPRCLAAAGAMFALTYGAWMALVIHAGLLADYKYLFYINRYEKPAAKWWMLMSLWWSFHGGLWVDHILIPLAGVIGIAAIAAWKTNWGRILVTDPVFGASLLAVSGYLMFMTVQNHPQPRYFAVVAVFCAFVVALGTGAFLSQPGRLRQVGWGVAGLAAVATGSNAAWTTSFVLHPEYTFVEAARALTHYIDQHPNGRRILVATSGDQITLMSHLPSLCDDFGTEDLVTKLGHYQPGWFASWNDLDPGTLADLHTRYWLEQVATFDALDDPERNKLVLFKLHPWPGGRLRDEGDENLEVQLPEDRFDVMVE